MPQDFRRGVRADEEGSELSGGGKMNCTAELFCAGKCVGDTLYNCTDNLSVIGIFVAFVVLLFFGMIIWDLESQRRNLNDQKN